MSRNYISAEELGRNISAEDLNPDTQSNHDHFYFDLKRVWDDIVHPNQVPSYLQIPKKGGGTKEIFFTPNGQAYTTEPGNTIAFAYPGMTLSAAAAPSQPTHVPPTPSVSSSQSGPFIAPFIASFDNAGQPIINYVPASALGSAPPGTKQTPPPLYMQPGRVVTIVKVIDLSKDAVSAFNTVLPSIISDTGQGTAYGLGIPSGKMAIIKDGMGDAPAVYLYPLSYLATINK